MKGSYCSGNTENKIEPDPDIDNNAYEREDNGDDGILA